MAIALEAGMRACALGLLGAVLAAAGCLPDDAAPADAGPPLCDNSPPSQVVDRHVLGETFRFIFTPEGAVNTKLYVPANSLVHLSLTTSLIEEAHIFQITLPGCTTPELVMGMDGGVTTYDWKAPLVPGTYFMGGICVNHADMEFDIVVTP